MRKPVKPKRGRPPFKPTKAMKLQVEVLRADQWSKPRIARFIGISEETLVKHFADELKFGDDKIRGKIVCTLMNKAIEGNVAAARQLDKMISGTGFVPHDGGGAAKPKTDAAPKEEKVGKKEQAEIDATTAVTGTTWEQHLSPLESQQKH